MKRKNLMLSIAAAAVLGAFNPAFAGGGAKHGAADESSPPQASEQNAPSSTPSRSADASADAGVSAPDAGVSADANAGSGPTGEKSPSRNSQFGHSDMTLGGIGPQASSRDVDPQTGLDRGHPAN